MKIRANSMGRSAMLAIMASLSVVLMGSAWTFTYGSGSAFDVSNPYVISATVVVEMYRSPQELFDDADIVVIAKVTEDPVVQAIDRRVSGTGFPIPYLFYKVNVLEEIKGTTDDVITIARVSDTFSDISEIAESRLEADQTVVLYLEEWKKDEIKAVTDMSGFNHFYLTIGMDAGVFDQVGKSTSYAPRNPEHFGKGVFDITEIKASE